MQNSLAHAINLTQITSAQFWTFLMLMFTWRIAQQNAEEAQPRPPCKPRPSAWYKQEPSVPHQLPTSYWVALDELLSELHMCLL